MSGRGPSGEPKSLNAEFKLRAQKKIDFENSVSKVSVFNLYDFCRES